MHCPTPLKTIHRLKLTVFTETPYNRQTKFVLFDLNTKCGEVTEFSEVCKLQSHNQSSVHHSESIWSQFPTQLSSLVFSKTSNLKPYFKQSYYKTVRQIRQSKKQGKIQKKQKKTERRGNMRWRESSETFEGFGWCVLLTAQPGHPGSAPVCPRPPVLCPGGTDFWPAAPHSCWSTHTAESSGLGGSGSK